MNTFRATHTCVLRVTGTIDGRVVRETRVPVRVSPTRIEDECGDRYDLHMHGCRIIPARMRGGSTYHRRMLLETLRPVRFRNRLEVTE